MRNTLSILLASSVVLPTPLAQANSTKSGVASTTIPFSIEQLSGQRPVVNILLGRLGYRMVVHSNANFYLQVDHGHAAQADVRILRHTGSFGIEAAGKVSALGRDEGTLPLLSIGNRTWRDAPVSVFETPGDHATGMLGLKWISENRVVMDYSNQTLSISPTPAEMNARALKLRRANYTMLPMSHDSETGRYHVMAKLGEQTRPMTISTVASLIIDSEFAEVAKLPVGPKSGQYGGPGGATGPTYALSRPIQISIGGWTSRPISTAAIEDTYAYSGHPRPAKPVLSNGGMIGADFLIAHHAIVDFGNSRIYLQ